MVHPDQALRLDNLVHNLPLTHEAFRQWTEGRLPFWNPYLWSGSPLLADPQAQATYPLTWLAYVLAGDTPAAAMRILIALHVTLAASGAWVLGRSLGCTDLGALLAATVYGLNPYFAYVGTSFANELATVAWLPWMAFAAVRSARATTPWRWIAAAAVIGALAWAAGYPQLWVYCALLAVALGWCVGQFRVRALLRAAAGPALGLALSLPQILPFVALWLSSQRAAARTLQGLPAAEHPGRELAGHPRSRARRHHARALVLRDEPVASRAGGGDLRADRRGTARRATPLPARDDRARPVARERCQRRPAAAALRRAASEPAARTAQVLRLGRARHRLAGRRGRQRRAA